jgi:hypothetical protein
VIRGIITTYLTLRLLVVKRNDADVPIHAVCFRKRSLHFPSPTRIETSAWGDRSEMLVELCGLGCFLGPQKFLHEKTNGRRDT